MADLFSKGKLLSVEWEQSINGKKNQNFIRIISIIIIVLFLENMPFVTDKSKSKNGSFVN